MIVSNYKVNYRMFDRILSESECAGICRSFARKVACHVSRAPKTFTRNKLNVVFFRIFGDRRRTREIPLKTDHKTHNKSIKRTAARTSLNLG